MGDLCDMLWRWLSFSHFWIALGAMVTTLLSWVWMPDISPSGRQELILAGWVGLSTGLGYTLQRAIKHFRHPEILPPMRRVFWSRYKSVMVCSWGLLWLGYNGLFYEFLEWGAILRLTLIVGVGVASLMYAIAPGMNGGLRKVVWLKVPLIALVWATITSHHPNQSFDVVLWLQRALFIGGLTLPFDIRDLEVDRPHMRTLASVYSPPWVLGVARKCLLLATALSAVHWNGHLQMGHVLLAVQAIWAWWLLRPDVALPRLSSKSETVRERCTGWVLDGVLVWPGILLVLEPLGQWG